MVPWCPVTAVPGLSPCPAPSSGAAGAPLGSALQLWAPAAGAAGEGRARLAAPALRDTGLAHSPQAFPSETTGSSPKHLI